MNLPRAVWKKMFGNFYTSGNHLYVNVMVCSVNVMVCSANDFIYDTCSDRI